MDGDTENFNAFDGYKFGHLVCRATDENNVKKLSRKRYKHKFVAMGKV